MPGNKLKHKVVTQVSNLYRIAPIFVVENFHNYTVTTKVLFTKIFDTRHKVSLASNAQVAQVFQATVFVLHSHHPLHSVLGYDRGRDFSLYVTNLLRCCS